jgi:hypothetical protein
MLVTVVPNLLLGDASFPDYRIDFSSNIIYLNRATLPLRAQLRTYHQGSIHLYLKLNKEKIGFDYSLYSSPRNYVILNKKLFTQA